MSQFRATRNLYLESLSGFNFPLTYSDWFNADAEYKAALLFVNFFEQIELAWYKTRFSFVLEEDAVSQVNVYLMKNIPVIEADEKRFTPSYIYTVAANCLRSLTYIERDINREKLETSNEVTLENDTVDLFDLAPANDDSYETRKAKEAVWSIIHRMGPKAEKVVNHILNPDDSLNASRSGNHNDRLRSISVSESEYNQIISNLRTELRPYLSDFLAIASDIVVDMQREQVVNQIALLEDALQTITDEAKQRKCKNAIKKLKAELVDYDRFQAKCTSKRDQFVAEMNKIEQDIRNATSSQDKKNYRKALKKMSSELALYDMLQAGYSA